MSLCGGGFGRQTCEALGGEGSRETLGAHGGATRKRGGDIVIHRVENTSFYRGCRSLCLSLIQSTVCTGRKWTLIGTICHRTTKYIL